MTGSGAAGWPDPEHLPADRLDARTLDLLERALAWTGGVLRAVPDDPEDIPTPCRGWDLERLLGHLEDALDAFTEAATGRVRVGAPGAGDAAPGRAARLERKACGLVAAWRRGGPVDVRLGEEALAAEVLVPAAALEVAVHGWDVAWAVAGSAGGDASRCPAPRLDARLARDLAPAAGLLVPRGAARAGWFDPPPDDLPGPEDDLLAWLGRREAAQAAGRPIRKRAPSPSAPP